MSSNQHYIFKHAGTYGGYTKEKTMTAPQFKFFRYHINMWAWGIINAVFLQGKEGAPMFICFGICLAFILYNAAKAGSALAEVDAQFK